MGLLGICGRVMEVALPNFRGEEKNTLYIIGNGFDLFHDLKTSFVHFRSWLLKNKYTDFIDILEAAFPSLKNSELLWNGFEMALGETEPIKIHQILFQGEDDGCYDEEIQKRVHNRIKPFLDNIPNRLREWIGTVKLDGVKRKVPLSKDSKYLSFNYTLLLEDVYWITSGDNLLHIHGSLGDKTPLTTGHNCSFSEQESSDNVNEEKSCQLISKDLNNLKKPVRDIIRNNIKFFDNLDEIMNIVVFGLSLSEIDRLYLTEVFHHVHDNSQWYFVCYDEETKIRYQQIVHGYNDALKQYFGSKSYCKKMLLDNCKFINIIK